MKKETWTKICSFLEKHEKIIFGVIIVLFAFMFYLSYMIHNIPYTVGWGNSYADLMIEGKMPYRDFYYYLPPLNLLIDLFLWKFSFGHIFVYTLFRIIERIVIILCMYNLISKFAKPRYAAIGSMLGVVIFSAQYYDIIGDYNQTTLLLAIVLTSIYIRFVKQANETEITDKKQFKYLLYGGIILGLSFLLKQTLFLADTIIFFIAITLFFIIKKRKSYIKSIGMTLIGIFIPLAITGIWLAANNALVPFIEQVYLNVDSKGSLISILVNYFLVCIKFKNILVVAFTAICIYFYKKKLVINEKNSQKDVAYSALFLIMLTLILCLLVLIGNVMSLDKNTTPFIRIIIFEGCITILTSILQRKKERNKNKEIAYYIALALIIFISVVIKYATDNSGMTVVLLFEGFENFELLFQMINIGSVLFWLCLARKCFKTKDTETFIWYMLLSGGIAYSYNRAMAASQEITNVGSVFLIPILVTYILHKSSGKRNVLKYMVVLSSVMIPIACMSSKLVTTYMWWGWYEPTLEEKRWNSINVPGLEGYRVTKETKEMYEEIYKVIKENSNEDSIIYGFPHIKIFNVLLKNENMNYFVPVPFYDVCSDSYIKKDIETLKQNPPDIVVFVDIKDAFEKHEEVYRNGRKLEQREFQEWLLNEAEKGNYTLIGQHGNLYVYKINNGEEIKYTYFQKQELNK